jgi:alkyl hydroperoxide reductase subunit AhpC
MDTIVMESLEIKLSQFNSNNGDNYTLKDGTKYVVMYYWRNDVFSKNFTKNFRYFKKFAREHHELNIQVIAVSTDKISR